MKKLIAFVLLLFVATVMGAPVFADSGQAATDPTGSGTSQEQIKNVQTGTENVATGWTEVLDSTHAEASKGKSAGEQITGVVAGGAIGVRRAIHRVGAGAIDLLTFWIPKKQPLIQEKSTK